LQDACLSLALHHGTARVSWSLAEAACPSVKEKNITPHTLRHTAAMSLLRGGVDTSVIALWLGHQGPETTQVYLHADMTIKEQALARVQQPGRQLPGRVGITWVGISR
jgi:integrase/recombinase XerD